MKQISNTLIIDKTYAHYLKVIDKRETPELRENFKVIDKIENENKITYKIQGHRVEAEADVQIGRNTAIINTRITTIFD